MLKGIRISEKFIEWRKREVDLLKFIFQLIGIISIMSLMFIFSGFEEDQKNANSAEIVTENVYIIPEIDLIFEGEEAKEYVIKNLGNNSHYLEVFEEDYNRYINKEHKVKGNFARLEIHPEKKCDGTGCTTGGFLADGTTFTEIYLYKNIIKLDSNEWIFSFIHENGHLLMAYYFNVTDMVEWNMLHEESIRLLRENMTDEFWRDYSKNNNKEDFADSYAIYRLGDEFAIRMVDKTITEDRKKFVERIENKAKAYLDDDVVVLGISK